MNHILSEGRNVNIFTIFAGLRHDYISTPVSRQGPEPSAMFPSYFDTSDETIKIKSGSTPSSSWKPTVPSSSSSCQSPLSLGSKYGCQSPKLSRLQQQVTQFKLLKLAQSQGTRCRCLSVPVLPQRVMLALVVIEHRHLEFSSNLAVSDRNHHSPDQVPFKDQPALPPGCEEQPKFRHRRSPAC